MSYQRHEDSSDLILASGSMPTKTQIPMIDCGLVKMAFLVNIFMYLKPSLLGLGSDSGSLHLIIVGLQLEMLVQCLKI